MNYKKLTNKNIEKLESIKVFLKNKSFLNTILKHEIKW